MVLQSFIQTSLLNIFEFPLHLALPTVKKHNLINKEAALLVMVDEFTDIMQIKLLSNISKEVYVLTDKIRYQNLSKYGLNNIKYSSIDRGMIREPENFFDFVFLARFHKNVKYFDLELKEFLNESMRVLKPGGVFALTGRTEVKLVQNYYADILLQLYNEFNSSIIYNFKELRTLLQNLGLINIDIIDDYGVLLAIGWKQTAQ